MAIWRKQGIGFDLAYDMSDHPVATLVVETLSGRLVVMAEPVLEGRTLTLVGLHMHGERAGANEIGHANLMVVAQAFMESMDVDELVVAGGLRTTGEGVDRTPRPVRFTRRTDAHLEG